MLVSCCTGIMEKDRSMTRRRPKRYTILISCTGRQPLVFSFRPIRLLLMLSLGIGLPLAILLTLLYSYADRNTQLAQRNTQLTQEASNILKRLELLEDKVGTLKDQSALPQDATPQSEPQSNGSPSDAPPSGTLFQSDSDIASSVPQRTQLEFSSSAEPEVLLSVARRKIPSLLQSLQTTTEPLTEKDLMRDAARPRGLPISGDAKISSPFGLQPNASRWGYELHQGVDFTAAYGNPVQSTAPGMIEEAGWDDRFGNRIVINHGYGYRTLYAHLSEVSVTVGTSVKRNQMIGYLGNSGRSSAPHLHYGIYRNGFVVDPEDYLN
jgi:murein DD-endopeptidase MepM/ murein hydrolase activator NlpD